MAIYEVLEEYVHAQRASIDKGEPIVVEARNRDTFERLVVKAMVVPPGGELEDSDDLVLRDLAENISEDGWKIKVLEELDPEKVDISPESEFRKSAGKNV